MTSTSESLTERLNEDLKAAMKARDRTRLQTIRSLRAAIREKELEEYGSEEAELEEQELMNILQRQAKQRRESIEQYRAGGREDLAEKEEEELAIIEEYLPDRLADEELRAVVEEVIEETGSTSMKDMGPVMGAAMDRLRGRADGNRVRMVVQELLGG